MAILDVPGASLYYETVGKGPVLITIAGANGDALIFEPISKFLAQHFTVLIYDRRGFSRSQLQGPQDYEHRIQTDADDARRLIQHVSQTGTAIVFGNSSGGMVALTLFTLYPEVVQVLIAHEPAAMTLLHGPVALAISSSLLYSLYRLLGPKVAGNIFLSVIGKGPDTAAMAEMMEKRRNNPFAKANQAYWFEHELRQYGATKLDYDVLARQSDRLIPAVGVRSQNQMPSRPITALAQKLGLPLLEVPGGHVGFALHPAEFAQVLVDALTKREAELGEQRGAAVVSESE